jgi:hypothetical protein
MASAILGGQRALQEVAEVEREVPAAGDLPVEEADCVFSGPVRN